MGDVRVLDRRSLALGVGELGRMDADLAEVVRRFGPPPLWARRPGFATLVQIVLEQQVSLASAKAVFGRLQTTLGKVTPERVADAGVSTLRDVGFTAQKAGYCNDLAVEIHEGRLDLRAISRSDDARARERLMAIRGVGPWSADIYRLMALRRPDVWPDGDLALAESAKILKRLRKRPSVDRLRRMARAWKPWRSVAARILWHNYLSLRRQRDTERRQHERR